VIEICAGLRYLHLDKKVVHRDFTPTNLMITKDNHVKIADFGLAKQRGTHSSSTMKTFVGTIQYSCPEIVRNQPYSEKADI
jgi:Serine/threonine protein kinase